MEKCLFKIFESVYYNVVVVKDQNIPNMQKIISPYKCNIRPINSKSLQ